MPKNKVKLYKNSERQNSEEHKPYVPQYQLLGVKPEEYQSPVFSPDVTVATSNEGNPRIKNQGFEGAYTEIAAQTAHINFPGVGNNTEQIWASVDGEMPDYINNSQVMIDNNDYITDDGAEPTMEQDTKDPVPVEGNQELLSVLENLENQEYLLIVNGVCLYTGSLTDVEEQTRALVFGEHKLSAGEPVPINQILVIKKVTIKMGLFLE